MCVRLQDTVFHKSLHLRLIGGLDGIVQVDAPSKVPDEAFLDSCGHLNEGVQQHGRGPRLYVGGIHSDITEDDVKMHFSRWGRVVDVYFPGM